jgi:hypothetical protein
MANKDFTSGFTADISAEQALEKISKIPEWWGVSFSGSTENQGDKFTIKMGGDSYFDFTVTEYLPGKRTVWLATDCNMPWYTDKKEWAQTRLIFDLRENDGVTELTFTHEGLTPASECYKDCEPGWTHWIKTSLHSYLTTGKGVFRPPTK